MKIVVNCRFLRKEKMDGIGWVTYHTTKYIVQKNPHITFYLLFDTEINPDFIFGDNVVPIRLYPPALHPILNLVWFEFSVKRVLKKIKPDLFLSADGILCLGWNGPQYALIHDINFVHIPKDLKRANRLYFNTFFPQYARKAKRIGTVSEYSKADIVKSFGVPPDKIDVFHLGVNSGLTPMSNEEQDKVREKYTAGKPYFIFIGTLHPRKNIYRLMQAFEAFKQEVPNDLKLLLVGWEMYRTDELHQLHATLACKEDIIFTGRVKNAEIHGLISASMCMTFVPYFEGFGIPPIEAMSCRVPVIASNITSIPEVVGDAGIQVDPYSVEEIKNAMVRIYTDKELRETLIKRGAERIKLFTWERTSQLYWQSIEKCLNE
jgi:glycosyltransferase involved in cell wall biosynthesis